MEIFIFNSPHSEACFQDILTGHILYNILSNFCNIQICSPAQMEVYFLCVLTLLSLLMFYGYMTVYMFVFCMQDKYMLIKHIYSQ